MAGSSDVCSSDLSSRRRISASRSWIGSLASGARTPTTTRITARISAKPTMARISRGLIVSSSLDVDGDDLLGGPEPAQDHDRRQGYQRDPAAPRFRVEELHDGLSIQ